MWRGLRNNDQKPNRNRSSAERLGARRRERLRSGGFLEPNHEAAFETVREQWMEGVDADANLSDAFQG